MEAWRCLQQVAFHCLQMLANNPGWEMEVYYSVYELIDDIVPPVPGTLETQKLEIL